jgi:hypothetical protein
MAPPLAAWRCRRVITENLLKLFYDIFIDLIIKAVRYGSFIRESLDLSDIIYGGTRWS